MGVRSLVCHIRSFQSDICSEPKYFLCTQYNVLFKHPDMSLRQQPLIGSGGWKSVFTPLRRGDKSESISNSSFNRSANLPGQNHTKTVSVSHPSSLCLPSRVRVLACTHCYTCCDATPFYADMPQGLEEGGREDIDCPASVTSSSLPLSPFF